MRRLFLIALVFASPVQAQEQGAPDAPLAYAQLPDAGQEAEAIVCWSDHADAERLWPIAAFDADNRPGRPYACARIAYSIRGGEPQWRAFIDQAAGGLAEP